MMASKTASTPTAIPSFFRAVGAVTNRVSISMRAESPGCGGTFRSVKIPPTWGFFSAASTPEAPGMPTKSAPAAPASAQMCSTLQALAAIQGNDFVTVEHLNAVAVPVLAHRLLVRREAQKDFPDGAAVIRDILAQTGGRE